MFPQRGSFSGRTRFSRSSTSFRSGILKSVFISEKAFCTFKAAHDEGVLYHGLGLSPDSRQIGQVPIPLSSGFPLLRFPRYRSMRVGHLVRAASVLQSLIESVQLVAEVAEFDLFRPELLFSLYFPRLPLLLFIF